MDPRHVMCRGVGRLDLGHDLVEVHGGGVDDPRPGRGLGHDLGRHQRARVEADRAALDQPQAADGDQVGGARAGADEMDGHPTR